MGGGEDKKSRIQRKRATTSLALSEAVAAAVITAGAAATRAMKPSPRKRGQRSLRRKMQQSRERGQRHLSATPLQLHLPLVRVLRSVRAQAPLTKAPGRLERCP